MGIKRGLTPAYTRLGILTTLLSDCSKFMRDNVDVTVFKRMCTLLQKYNTGWESIPFQVNANWDENVND